MQCIIKRMLHAYSFRYKNITRYDAATGQSSHVFHLNSKHYLALLFIAVFGTYYHSIIRGGFINLDDTAVVTRLLNEPTFVLKDVFFLPTATYYRPMIELSYRLDHLLWFDSASGWHLTNVIIHTANTWLVYLISCIMFSTAVENKKPAAFYSAMLYGMNPLATEAVCWVSGRSELILAFFMLASFYCYLLFSSNRLYWHLMLSGILYLCAASTKETALVLPVLFVVFEYTMNGKKDIGKSFTAIGCFLLLTGVYFLFLRRAGIDTSSMQVGVGASGLTTVRLYENFLILFASLGYYVKKILLPYPLNFAIDSINLMVHSVVGLALLVAFSLRGRFLPSTFRFFSAWIFITILPAIAAAVLHIPWVPWAERYLYVPLVAYSMALGLTFALLLNKERAYAARFILVLLAVVFWITTLHRTYVWADEVRLWENTAHQSDYGPVQYHYGQSLLSVNREREGIEQMKKAIAKGYSYIPYLVLSGIAFNKNDYEGSEWWLRKAMQDYPQKAELHKYLAENYLGRKSDESDSRRLLLKAIDEYTLYAELRRDDPSAYLRVAQLYKAAHLEERAVPFLEKILKIDSNSSSALIARKYLRDGRSMERTP
jgi:tetratricopeptide (TPR) repeat protein